MDYKKKGEIKRRERGGKGDTLGTFGRHSDETDKPNDDAEGANIRLWKLEWLEAWVLRNAENAIIIFFALLYTLNEGTLAGVKDINTAPLIKEYITNLSTSYNIAIIIKWHHRVARNPDKEVCTLCLKLRDGVMFAVSQIHSFTVGCRKACQRLRAE